MLIQVVWAELVELHRGVTFSVAVACAIYFVALEYLAVAGHDPYRYSDYIMRDDFFRTEEGRHTFFVFEAVGMKLSSCIVVCLEMYVFVTRVHKAKAREQAHQAALAEVHAEGPSWIHKQSAIRNPHNPTLRFCFSPARDRSFARSVVFHPSPGAARAERDKAAARAQVERDAQAYFFHEPVS